MWADNDKDNTGDHNAGDDNAGDSYGEKDEDDDGSDDAEKLNLPLPPMQWWSVCAF